MRRAKAAVWMPGVLLSLGLVAPEAWAYLDPSTGSMILSAIVGMFFTAGLAVKTFWYKLRGLFRRDDRRDQPRKPDQQDEQFGQAPGAD